jgi:hypothetical protein
MAYQMRVTERNAMLDLQTTAAGANSLIRIYSGTPPANVATALSGNTLLATLTNAAALAPAASGGVLTLNAIGSDLSADANGTATFFRILQSDATTVIAQGTVGTSGADMILGTTTFAIGNVVSISAATITAPGA